MRLQVLALSLFVLGAPSWSSCRKKPVAANDGGAPPSTSTSAAARADAGADASVAVKEASNDTKKPFVAPAPGAAGPAYVAVSGGLAYILADGASGVIKGSFDHLSLGSDGRVYATQSSASITTSIVRIEGTTVKPIAKTTEAVGYIAVDKDERVYLASPSKGVLIWDKAQKKWANSDPQIQFLDALSVDPKGRAWTLGRQKVALFDGAAWKVVATSTKVSDYKSFATVGDRFFVIGYEQIYEVVNDALVPFGPRYNLGAANVATASNGLFAMPDFDYKERKRSMVLLDPTGGQSRLDNSDQNALLDANGRLWTIYDGELEVKSLIDKSTTVYPVGTLPILDDYTAGFMFPTRALILGGGPKLPPVGPVRKVSALKGKILIGGKPAAEMELQICRDAAYSGAEGSAPCTGASTLKTTTTAKGDFSFSDVPIGRYDLTMKKADGKWAVDHLVDKVKMVPGKPATLGTIRYQ